MKRVIHAFVLIGFSSVLWGPAAVSAGSGAVPPAVQQSWQEEYRSLEAALAERHTSAGFAKRLEDERLLRDRQAMVLDSDVDPLSVVLRRTAALLDDLERKGAGRVSAYRSRLDEIAYRARTGLGKSAAPGSTERVALYMEASALRRQVALTNPLLDFNDILFVERALGCSGSGGSCRHICDQFYGCNAQTGGSIYIIKDFKSATPRVVDVLENSTVANGSLLGKSLAGGAFISPDLSFDGSSILFGARRPAAPGVTWTANTNSSWREDVTFHVYRAGIDGSDLRQLTRGEGDDFDPCWLPNGRIMFISTKRGGFGRCHGRPVPTYTLYSMKPDGSDMYCVDWHETNEWQPSVDNSGMVVYSRWDYVDRSDCIAHHIWQCYPDGRDPRSYHGNYPNPHSTTSGSGWQNGEFQRPFAELNTRAIPGTSGKYVATSSPHHGEAYGALVVLDLSIPDDGKVSQVTKITDGPMAHDNASGDYGTAWPLSEDYYLCNYKDGIYLIDVLGNKDLIHTAITPGFRPIDPIPVKARPTPPVIPTKTWQGERESLPDRTPATLSVNNVYIGDKPLPAGVKIKWMRIVQLSPKMTPNKDSPRVGYASETLARMPLGIVPVEDDGSVYCEAPVEKTLYFQLLDENGMAVQSMRSATYVHKGEQMTCTGCHEDKWAAPPANPTPMAMRRAPSPLEPEVIDGAIPFNWHRLVKPVLESKCTPCHAERAAPPDMSYSSLTPYAFAFPGSRGDHMNAVVGGTRATPGQFGAQMSKLVKYLGSDHYDVALTDRERRRVTLWLDLNSNEFGACRGLDDQRAGKIVWAELDVDPKNPLGTENPLSNLPASAVRITPSGGSVKPGGTLQFAARAVDELGRPLAVQPAFTWSASAGSVDPTGLFAAGATDNLASTITATATSGGAALSGTASVYVSSAGAALMEPGLITRLLVLHDGNSPYLPSSLTGVETVTTAAPGAAVTLGGQEYVWKALDDDDGLWVDDQAQNDFAACFALEVLGPVGATVRIAFRHDDDLKIWRNGTEVVSVGGWDGGKTVVSQSITLEPGSNLFVARLREGSGGNHFAIKFQDENGNDIGVLYRPIGIEPTVRSEPRTIAGSAPIPVRPFLSSARGVITVGIPSELRHVVDIYDMRGALVARRAVRGPGFASFELPLSAGRYVALVTARGTTVLRRTVVSGVR